MDIQITEALNTLPVITYRWLGVNQLNLKENITRKIKPYHKQFLLAGNEVVKDITLVEPAEYHNLIQETVEYGVSKELVALGENSFNAGVLVQVPSGVVIQEPIRIQYNFDETNDIVIDNNLIFAGENSEVTLVIDYLTTDGVTAFHNGTTRVFAEPGSKITIVKVQRMNDQSYHFDSNLAISGYGAKVNWLQAELGSKKSITNYISNLNETSEAKIDSIYIGDGERQIDLSYHMKHQGRRSVSNIDTQGALMDRARKMFRGTIDFKKGSSQSIGSEEEYVILLDKGVQSDAVPLLLSEEDDVQGLHAASAGKVDPAQLYYMMSRGFSEAEARKLIVEAAFNPIIDLVRVAVLQKVIKDEIQRRLVGE